MLRPRFALLAALTLAAIETTTYSQCFVPDGLNGPCWAPANTTIPTFPAITLPGTSICWQQCTPTQACTNIVLGAPALVRCGVYSVAMTVDDCTAPQLASTLNLDYTRTWLEVDPAGAMYQVWRFVVKADVTPVPPLNPGCLVPPCLGPHPTAFYYGYIDYARDCTSGAIEAALVLFHNCDRFIHNPFFSNRPGAFHPNTSYAIVGPSTAANPFVAAAAVAPQGQVAMEALRNVPLPGSVLCFTEDVAKGVIQFIINGCVCPFALMPKQTTARSIRVAGQCVDPSFGATTFQTVNPGNPFPWLHDITTAIGNWVNPIGPFPGQEFVWVDETPAIFRDSCSVTGFGEVCYGASTSKGFQILPAGGLPPLDPNFTDLASNASWTPAFSPVFPFVGTVFPTRNLVYINVP
jgi:hypothetical protein